MWFIPLHNGVHRCCAGPGDAANTKCMLCKCKGDCTLVDYYLNELKATPGVLKYIVNGKLSLTSNGGSAHMNEVGNFS